MTIQVMWSKGQGQGIAKISQAKTHFFYFREERRRIVERYDQGREDGAVFDDWEDPKLEIYHTQDR